MTKIKSIVFMGSLFSFFIVASQVLGMDNHLNDGKQPLARDYKKYRLEGVKELPFTHETMYCMCSSDKNDYSVPSQTPLMKVSQSLLSQHIQIPKLALERKSETLINPKQDRRKIMENTEVWPQSVHVKLILSFSGSKE